MQETEPQLKKPSYWQLIFLQSKVNNAPYNGEALQGQSWDWPKDTYFQRRLNLIKILQHAEGSKKIVNGRHSFGTKIILAKHGASSKAGRLTPCAFASIKQSPMNGTLLSIQPRQIMREAGLDADFPVLPTKSGVQQALDETDYDDFPWSQSSIGHRNRLEGWIEGPQLHNLVHVWVGGDMAPGTSPNDPVFFLNHCNVDRIWEAWMGENGQVYAPAANQGPAGHRINDLMVAILGEALRPSDVLDPAQWYSYDSLTVA